MSVLWRVEFHCHTCYSPDCLVTPEALVRRARDLGLDKVVITDHNTIRGALAAREVDPDLIVVGEEILTTVGEFIAFYVQEEVPRGLLPEEVLARLRDQGAVIAISHPLDTLRGSAMGRENTLRFIRDVDALETYNARNHRAWMNEEAARLAEEHSLGQFGGSDAHSLWELGRVVTVLPPFDDPESLRAALRQSTVVGQGSPFWVHGISTISKLIKRVWSPCP